MQNKHVQNTKSYTHIIMSIRFDTPTFYWIKHTWTTTKTIKRVKQTHKWWDIL